MSLWLCQQLRPSALKVSSSTLTHGSHFWTKYLAKKEAIPVFTNCFSAIGRTWIQFNFHTTSQDLVPLHSKFSFLKYSYYSTTTFWFLNCKSFVGMPLVSDIDQIKKKVLINYNLTLMIYLKIWHLRDL